MEDDSDDDEEAVVSALCKLTTKVSVGPKKSQKQRRAIQKLSNTPLKQPLTPTEVKKIAMAVNSGEIKLPDLNLETKTMRPCMH